MTKWLLADRERNYHDDSDFYAVFFDDETGEVRSEEYGSTRYGGGYSVAPPDIYKSPVPSEIREKARLWLKNKIFESLKSQEFYAVMEPQDAERGDRLMLLSSGKFKDKQTGEAIPYEVGEVGEVIWIGAFGTFYRRGYNHPNRSNRRVGLQMADGRVVFVGLAKCRLAREQKSEQELLEQAEAYSQHQQYHVFFTSPSTVVI